MNKINKGFLIFILVVFVWPLVFLILCFFNSIAVKGLKDYKTNLEGLKSLQSLRNDIDFLEKKLSEESNKPLPNLTGFIAQLPGRAKNSGIRNIKIENLEALSGKPKGSAELAVVAEGRYQGIAGFTEKMERSELPVRITSLSIVRSGNGNLIASINLKYFEGKNKAEDNGN